MAGTGRIGTTIRAPVAAEGQDLFLRFRGQQRTNLGQNLRVGKMHLGDGIVRALGHAAAAAVTLGGDDVGGLALLVLDGAVGTGA